MGIVIREYQTEDVTAAITIWNQVVEDGVAFPQEENLTEETGDAFFKEQTLRKNGNKKRQISAMENWRRRRARALRP